MKKFQLVAIVSAGLILSACGKEQVESVDEAPVDEAPVADAVPACTAEVASDVQSVEIVPGLVSKTLTIGCGEGAVAGQTAVVHYTGWLQDLAAENHRGEKFDSSRDRDQHFSFPLGGGRVIKGWDQGVVGMTAGEVRELTIAPELAYGERNIGVIPSGSTLIFEVELIAVEGGQPE